MNILSYLALNRTYHVKSVGSKSTLEAIASDIATHQIQSVSVCLDSDYDRALGIHLVGPRIAYTCGYSWESDVLSDVVVRKILEHLIGPPTINIARQLQACLSAFKAELAYWVEIDAALRRMQKPCVFDRDRPLSAFNIGAVAPFLKADVLRTRLIEIGYTRRPRRVLTINADQSTSVAFGRFVGKAIYHIVTNIARAASPGLRVDYDGFMRIAIRETFFLLNAGTLIRLAAHYASQRPAFA